MGRESVRYPTYRDTCDRCGRIETWTDEPDARHVTYVYVSGPPVRDEEGEWRRYASSAPDVWLCETCVVALTEWFGGEGPR
jgi:hypothetical protein